MAAVISLAILLSIVLHCFGGLGSQIPHKNSTGPQPCKALQLAQPSVAIARNSQQELLTQLIILACAACGPPRTSPDILEYAHITSAPTPIHT